MLYLPLNNCANTNNPLEVLSNLNRDGLSEVVAKYLDDSFDFSGSLNNRKRNTYVDGRISRFILSESLDIPMITLMDENEDGINELLGMSIFKGEPKKFFLVLYNAVFNRNFCPKLQLHLLKIMKEIYNYIELKNSERRELDFNSKCGELLVKRDEISQVIEWFKDDPTIYYDNIFNLSFEKKKSIYSEIIENENLRDILKEGLRNSPTNDSKQYLQLLSDAILFNFPIEVESEYFIKNSLEAVKILLENSNFNLSETENVALYLKLKRIIEENQEQSLELKYKCNLYNELRFGSVDEIDVSHLDIFVLNSYIFLYLKLAYFAKKPSSFKTIVLHFKDSFDENFFNWQFFDHWYCFIDEKDKILASNDMKVVKMYFDVLEVLGKSEEMIYSYDSHIIIFMKWNCLVEELNVLENVKDRIKIKFKSSLEMISEGVPNFIELIIDISELRCSRFIQYFWRYIKTENSEKLSNLISNFFTIDRIKIFLTGMNAKKYALKYIQDNYSEEFSDLMKFKDFKEGFEYGSDNFIIEAAYETFIMISEDEHLKTILRNYQIKLFISPLTTQKFIENPINLYFGNIEIYFINFFYSLKCAKNDLEISRIEQLSGFDVSAILPTIISSRRIENREEFYYEYRHAFIHWFKGQHKQTIPKFYQKLLELEYQEIIKPKK